MLVEDFLLSSSQEPREGNLVVEPSHVTRTGNSHTLVSRQRLQFTFVGSPTLASDPCLFDKQGFHQKTRAPFTEEQETSQSSNSVHLLVDEDKRTMHAFRGTCQKGQKSSCNLTTNFVHKAPEKMRNRPVRHDDARLMMNG